MIFIFLAYSSSDFRLAPFFDESKVANREDVSQKEKAWIGYRVFPEIELEKNGFVNSGYEF